MKSKEEFKEFVKKYPSFASHVKEKNVSWQELYELFNLYDEDSNVWDKYKREVESSTSLSFEEIINSLKGINLDSFQNNLSSIQKAVSFLEEFTKKEEKPEEILKANLKDKTIDKFYSD